MRAAFLLLGLVAGCDLHPANNDSGGPINLAASGPWVFVARGTSGLDVVRASDSEKVTNQRAETDSDSFDDVAFSSGYLIALDADDGKLSTFRVSPEGKLDPAAVDVPVAAGPYSGVSARGRRVVVSGGTCEISLFDLDQDGGLRLSETLSAFRGQPDVTLLQSGDGAILSTHFSGSDSEFKDGAEFGISSLRVAPLAIADTRGLPGSGFSEGGGTPASWPTRSASQGDWVFVAHGGGFDAIALNRNLGFGASSHLDLPFSAVDVAVRGDRAFVVGAQPGSLATIDISDPQKPRLLGSEPVGSKDASPTAIVATASGLFIATTAGLVSIVR